MSELLQEVQVPEQVKQQVEQKQQQLEPQTVDQKPQQPEPVLQPIQELQKTVLEMQNRLVAGNKKSDQKKEEVKAISHYIANVLQILHNLLSNPLKLLQQIPIGKSIKLPVLIVDFNAVREQAIEGLSEEQQKQLTEFNKSDVAKLDAQLKQLADTYTEAVKNYAVAETNLVETVDKCGKDLKSACDDFGVVPQEVPAAPAIVNGAVAANQGKSGLLDLIVNTLRNIGKNVKQEDIHSFGRRAEDIFTARNLDGAVRSLFSAQSKLDEIVNKISPLLKTLEAGNGAAGFVPPVLSPFSS